MVDVETSGDGVGVRWKHCALQGSSRGAEAGRRSINLGLRIKNLDGH